MWRAAERARAFRHVLLLLMLFIPVSGSVPLVEELHHNNPADPVRDWGHRYHLLFRRTTAGLQERTQSLFHPPFHILRNRTLQSVP